MNTDDGDEIDSIYWEGSRTKDGRPIGTIRPNEIGQTLDDLEDVLLDQGIPIFQQNGRLVTLVHHNQQHEAERDQVRRPPGSLVALDVSPHLLAEMASAGAKWVRLDMRKNTTAPDPDDPKKKKKGLWVPAPFTVEYARHYLARGQWKLRTLRGTVNAPTLRRDGTLITEHGYDAASQLFFDQVGETFPDIAEAPSREDAAAALEILLGPIKDFPFEPDVAGTGTGPSAARSVALSAILTGLVRPSMDTAPAHVFDAPVMGTGKTKLSEIASVIATGKLPAAISYGDTNQEFEKRLFSVLIKGARCVIVDNIDTEVESDQFCTILTSATWESRVLGLSKMVEVPTNTLWLLNGNRVRFKGDITVRLVACNLDAGIEDPQTRTFDREPVAYSMEHRSALVHAGITVLYAHALAGFPGAKGLPPSRFPDWDRMVRGALVWLGQSDPQATRDRITVSDPVREVHGAILREFEYVVGLDVPITAKALVTQSEVTEEEEVGDYRWGPFGAIWPLESAEALHEALGTAANTPWPDAQKVGTILSRFVGRVYQGRVIRSKPNPKGASTFWVSKA